MHVRFIGLQKFMSHDEAEVVLPERGIMLVTGQNGFGKSSLFIESVSAACWGKTMRGTPPWRDEEGAAIVSTPDVVVERRRAAKKPAVLSWSRPGEKPAKYDTPSKAQDALAGIIGSWDVWRRTSVFSSADAAHFTLASDKDRKLLLESILGLDRFDTALKQCREEIREVQAKIRTYESQAAVLSERKQGLVARLADLDETETAESQVVAEPIADEKLARMRALHVELTTQLKNLETMRRGVERESAQADAALRTRQTEAQRLDRDACPTCGQPIKEAERKKLRAEVAEAKASAARVRETVDARLHAMDGEREGLEEERREVRTYLDKAERIARDHAQLEKNRQQRADKRELLAHQISEVERDLAEAKERTMLLCHDHDELEVCERVLGLKGVRAHMLGDAMRAITELANRWLARLFPGVTLLLHEEGDKVALEVKGLQHGYGYHAASSGQRRRIDIALLLALSDLEAASRGAQPGTLFLDEVADSLDEEGIDSFADVLVDLARTRAVVLISHNPGLYETLPYVARVVVEERGVRVL